MSSHQSATNKNEKKRRVSDGEQATSTSISDLQESFNTLSQLIPGAATLSDSPAHLLQRTIAHVKAEKKRKQHVEGLGKQWGATEARYKEDAMEKTFRNVDKMYHELPPAGGLTKFQKTIKSMVSDAYEPASEKRPSGPNFPEAEALGRQSEQSPAKAPQVKKKSESNAELLKALQDSIPRKEDGSRQ
jgi:hypothetical protein